MVALIGHPNALLKLNKTWWETTSTLKGVLLNGWTPNVNTDLTYSQISAYEIALSGYTAGGVTLGSKTVDLSGGLVRYRAANAVWAALGVGTVSRFALCANDGVDNWIVGHVDISSKQPNGGIYSVDASANGWLTDEWST
jgi:hypothetical protein